jgi:hypothetical protein
MASEPIRVHVLRGAAGQRDLVDWGPITPAGGVAGIGAAAASHTRGILLYRGTEKHPEAGLWECTPGCWDCRVERDEFCHFLAGRCVYTHESGERTEIRGGDAAFFPAGWNGRCEVIETVRKVYLIR